MLDNCVDKYTSQKIQDDDDSTEKLQQSIATTNLFGYRITSNHF